MSEAFEEFKENPIRYIKTWAMNVVVVAVAFAYIFYQTLTFEKSQLNPLILVAEAFMGIVCGVVIKQALGEDGLSKGYNSDKWDREEKLYAKSCNDALPYMDKTDNFYRAEEIERKRNYRREHLQSVMLRYEDWFDMDGNYIGSKSDIKKLSYRQRKMLKRCVRVKIRILNMFSISGTTTEQDTKREVTDRMQRSKNLSKNSLSAVLVAIIGVYFVPIFDQWNWANLIASTMQVTLWVLFGVIQLYTNYNFVVEDRVAILKRKKELIVKFCTGCQNGLYTKNPYDEMSSHYSVGLPRA